MGELRTLRLVVASPNDMKPERDVLKHVIEELNDGMAATCGVQLKLSCWEDDAYAGFHVDGPQGLIDAILRIPECDIFLGIFGSRFGTPTSDGRTGTEHEFTLAYETWKQRQRPQIMVYFNQGAPPPKTPEEADQWKQVLEFQQQFLKEGLWWPYKGKARFEKLVRRQLTNWLRQQHGKSSAEQRSHFASDMPATVELHGSGGQAYGPHATAGGEKSVVVGGDVHGNIYQIYQSAPGRGVLTPEAFARVLEDYLRWVQTAYNKVRLCGLESLPTAQRRPIRDLPSIFVPLTLRRVQPPRREEVEQLARELHGDNARAYLQLADAKHKEGNVVPHETLLTINDKVAIIGGAGSGKSTIVAYLAALLATAALKAERPPGMKLPQGKTSLIPLAIPLRYFHEYQRLCEHSPQLPLHDPRAGTLAGFIPWYHKRRNPALEMSEDFFDRLLRGGGCLLMLDGLDEVASREERGRVRQQVEDLVNEVYPNNTVIVTAREAGYREDAVFGDDFLRVDVQRLDDAQIHRLVANWCRQLYPGEKEQRTTELVEAIQEINRLRADDALPPFVSTPLLTTMVVSVKWGEIELPRERAKLYEACVKVILQAQYIPDDAVRKELVGWGGSWETQRDWLSVLALAMHEGGRAGAVVPETRVRAVLSRELAPDTLQQFLEAVRHRGGLLEEKAELFQFAHLTFQEFLVARWLAKQQHAAWPHLLPHITDPWWREVFLLTYGFAQVDYAPFAREYLEWLSNLGSDDETQLAGLELAGSALLEVERPNPDICRQQAVRLQEILTNPMIHASGILRARAGDTLARLGDPRFRADTWFLPDEPLLGFIEIPAGPFLMGSDKDNDPQALDEELSQHPVQLPSFYIARHPVTVAQFRVFVEQSGYKPEDEDSVRGPLNQPVTAITWHEALTYCEWLTECLRQWNEMLERLATLLKEQGWQVTLPSEAEWEKAARGTDGCIYPWGNEFDAGKANTEKTGIGRLSAVGCFPQGVSPYGCLDMAGNVWEWTRSLWGKEWDKPDFRYPYQPDNGREQRDAPDDIHRVLRGGSSWSFQRHVRCAARLRDSPDHRSGNFGFRLVVRP